MREEGAGFVLFFLVENLFFQAFDALQAEFRIVLLMVLRQVEVVFHVFEVIVLVVGVFRRLGLFSLA